VNIRHVQHLVVKENKSVNVLVSILFQKMVVMAVKCLVLPLNQDHAQSKSAQSMVDTEHGQHTVHVANHADQDSNKRHESVTTQHQLMVEQIVKDQHPTAFNVILNHVLVEQIVYTRKHNSILTVAVKLFTWIAILFTVHQDLS